MVLLFTTTNVDLYHVQAINLYRVQAARIYRVKNILYHAKAIIRAEGMAR